MKYPGLVGRDARLAELLALLLQQSGHVVAAPASIDALLEAAGRAVDPAVAAQLQKPLAPIDPVTNGWLASLSDAFHLARRDGQSHTAGKLHEILSHFARADRPPVAYPPEVTEALATTSRALDLLAQGAEFNHVVEQTGVTAAVSLASVSALAAVQAAAEAPAPVVVVSMSGGVVEAISATQAADVIVLDDDIGTSDPDDLPQIGGKAFRVTERSADTRPGSPHAGSAFVWEVLADLDAADASRAAFAESEIEAAPRA